MKDTENTKQGKIGIFWFIRSNLISVTEDVSKGEIYSSCIDSSLEHYKYWETKDLDRKYGDDYAAFKRGRVVYDIAKKKFKIFAGDWLTDSQIRKICSKFNLDENNVLTDTTDDHYQLMDTGSSL